MSKFVSRFMKDESGATAIEYGLIAALIAAVIVTAVAASAASSTPPSQDRSRASVTKPASR
jgi:Flp pilus assembly pilin Flp